MLALRDCQASTSVEFSQDCPACGTRIKKALSTCTHACKCGYIEDRDIAANINILKKGLSTGGHLAILFG